MAKPTVECHSVLEYSIEEKMLGVQKKIGGEKKRVTKSWGYKKIGGEKK